MRAVRLKTEYLTNPLGTAFRNPRLTWNCQGGIRQTAYQIVTDTWDSGRVETSSMHAEYPLPLHDRERVTWRVRLWDETGTPGDWSEAFFEQGITSWQAKWITGNYHVRPERRYPVDCFRKTFSVEKTGPARLYITACGLYEAHLNGRRIGEFVLAPGLTDYRLRVQYQTYDVTALLQTGENEITVQLADGWYRGSVGAWGLRNQYGRETKLLAQLEIGGVAVALTDESWQWSDDGPIRFADNKDGEIVDARKIPTYSGRAKATHHPVAPSSSNNVPVTEHEHFRPKVGHAQNGRWLLDFGQNIAGYISFRLRAGTGERMCWRFGEMLDREGNLTLKNIQCTSGKKTTLLQQVDYLCREGENVYKTAFAVFGFRYAEVDTALDLSRAEIEAVAVYSDLEETGGFRCSHELINRFYRATVWSMKGNHLDIPTDCPTRERHGWTGDAQIFFGTAAYLFDFAAFAKKYLADIYDWQKRDGRLPQIAPCGGVDFYMWTMNGSVGWSDIGILYPYRIWKTFGDRGVLEKYYDRMVRYADFMIRRVGRDGSVRRGQSYGEWAEPADVCAFDWKDFIRPHPEVSTAYTSWVLGQMAEISEELGRDADAVRFRTCSERTRVAYRRMCELDTDRQAQLVRPLYMKLLDPDQSEYAKKRLIKALEHYNWRLGTGFLSTPLILDVLSDINIEAAYRLLENEEIPGWLAMPKAGATTVWEAWEGPNSTSGGIGSLNHYSKGAAVQWFFSTMCGIRPAGENRFTVEPRPGGSVSSAEAKWRSPWGEISSSWRRENGTTVYEVTVPTNCTAELRLPSGRTTALEAGAHTFTEP